MDRNALIGALLAGDRTAIGVLADSIEEEGDLALAEQTRKRKLHSRKLLRLSLELVPLKDALRFCCDFFQHAFRDIATNNHLMKCVSYVRDWTNPDITELESTLVEAEHVAAIVDVLAIRSEPLLIVDYLLSREAAGPHTASKSVGESIERFRAILRITTELLKAEDEGDHSRRRRKNNQLRQEIYRLAMKLQSISHMSRYRVENYFAELEWQLGHMRRSLSSK